MWIDYEKCELFKPVWTVSRNSSVPVVNLSRLSTIGYAADNMLILYDYKTGRERYFKKHMNDVVSLATDFSSKWMATSDWGRNNSVIVWNTKTGDMVFFIHKRYRLGCGLLYLSPCGKYLITVPNEEKENVVEIWDWTEKPLNPLARLVLEKDFDLKMIAFNPGIPEHFAVTSSDRVIFCTLEGGVIHQYNPAIYGNVDWEDVGNFTETVYADKSGLAITVTDTGHVVLWSDRLTLNNVETGEVDGCKPVTNEKNAIDQIQLQSEPLVMVRVVDSYIVVVNAPGTITFYNHSFQIEHYVEFSGAHGIVGLDFNIGAIDSMKETIEHRHPKFIETTIQRKFEPIYEWEKTTYEHCKEKLVKLNIRDCIVTRRNGKVQLVNFSKKCKNTIIPTFSSEVTALDVAPFGHYFCVGTKESWLCQVSCSSRVTLVQKQVQFHSTENVKQSSYGVSYLKFSRNGMILAVADNDGYIAFFTSAFLGDIYEVQKPITGGRVTKMEYSNSSKYLAVAGAKRFVDVYRLTEKAKYLGRCGGHSDKVTDFAFIIKQRRSECFFTIGEDRKFIEHNLQKCVGGTFQVKSVTRIDQTAIPLLLTSYPTEPHTAVVYTSEYKYRVIDIQTKECLRTSQAPYETSEQTSIQVIRTDNNQYMFYTAWDFIGLQRIPLDGNPYKYAAYKCTNRKIKVARIFPEGKHFIVLLETGTVLVGSLDVRKLNYLQKQGGNGIEPYCHALHKSGVHMNEVENYFIACQIQEGNYFSKDEQKISREIPMCKAFDVMRALGYFPSEYEIRNMLCEVTHVKLDFPELERKPEVRRRVGEAKHKAHSVAASIIQWKGRNASQKPRTRTVSKPSLKPIVKSGLDILISFETLVLLYFNHSHVEYMARDLLLECFKLFADPDLSNKMGEPSMKTTHLIYVLEETGEGMSKSEALESFKYLFHKMYPRSDAPSLKKIPEVMTFTYFFEELLGMTDITFESGRVPSSKDSTRSQSSEEGESWSS